jgi:hypothetical protein
MKKAYGVVLTISLLFISGCIIVGNSVGPDKFNPGKEGNKVGGGFTITYVAPEDGSVHLMDRKSGKSLLTENVLAGEEYKFDAVSLDKAQYKKWGINVDKADFVLYFYPKFPKRLPPMPPMPNPEGNPPMPPMPCDK